MPFPQLLLSIFLILASVHTSILLACNEEDFRRLAPQSAPLSKREWMNQRLGELQTIAKQDKATALEKKDLAKWLAADRP